MSVDERLLVLLQCPDCGADVVQLESSIVCTACNRRYPIRDGIPDMRVYSNADHSSELNETQARYEQELHDAEARSDYERFVVRVFGTKTHAVASGWSRDILDASCETVLDYGCGTGQLSRVLSRTISPLFAFDISELSLRQNIEQNGVLGVLGNALFLPFRAGAFDAVCINGVLHHIVDLNRASAEIARVASRLVFVSEGVPRGRPSLARALSYPECSESPYTLRTSSYGVPFSFLMCSAPRWDAFWGSIRRKESRIAVSMSAPLLPTTWFPSWVPRDSCSEDARCGPT